MEENNKKGPGTFYAIIGVATLVVAIIGATFAFFSASQTNTDIKGTTAEAGGLTVVANRVTTGTNSSIIPLNLIPNQTKREGSESEYVDATDQFDKAMAKGCKDDLGNNICDVYEVVVSNLSKTSTIQVQGKLSLSTSTTTNMYWTLINANVTKGGTEGAPEITFNGATAINDFTKVPQTKTGFLTYSTDKETTGENQGLNKAQSLTLYGTENTEAGASSATYYVLVWLEETGAEQQDVDASTAELTREYKGTITFDAVDAQGNKSGVTATFLS